MSNSTVTKMVYKQTQVYLVGAGPGDPELITVKGRRILSCADVVLYDFLAHPSLLAYCKPEAVLIGVGKKKGYHLKTQAQIHRLIKKWVKKGKTVVRLKGGDPLMFGRGGEEMAYLQKQGILFEVVPGVTSANGIAAYVGIPLTHRTLSRSVAFVTGSPSQGDVMDSICIPEADTLVFFMGLSHLPYLVQRLLAFSSFDTTTPVAFVCKGTLAHQKVIMSTLGTIEEDAKRIQETPVLWIVGSVVTLASQLGWRNRLLLLDRRIVIARSSTHNEQWANRLSDLGAEVVVFPLIRPTLFMQGVRQLTLSKCRSATTLIFTSANGVRFFFEILAQKKIGVEWVSQLKIIAVGPQTAHAISEYGLSAYEAPTSQQEGVMALLDTWPSLQCETIMIPGAKDSRPDLANWLQAKEVTTHIIPVYKTEKLTPPYWPIQTGDYVWFTSSSTAEAFFSHPDFLDTLHINACCLGPITAATVKSHYKGPCLVAKKATFEAMVEAMMASS